MNWFTEDEGPAVRDFWRAYDARVEELEGPGEAERVQALLRKGFRSGDWAHYEEELASYGERCASLGLEPILAFGGDLVQLVAPDLVRDHAASPDRLIAAIRVMGAFVARRAMIVGEAWARAVGSTERSLAITLQSMGDGVIATDRQGRIERMNPVASELSGWSVDEARGRWVGEVFCVVDEGTGHPIPCRVDEVLKERIVADLPIRAAILARDGSLRPIADSMAPIVDERGRIHGVVLVFRDLSRERDHERAMEESRGALSESHRRLRLLAERVETTREEERTRIARELHDELGQQLTAIRMDIGWLGHPQRHPLPEVGERLEAMSGMVDAIFASVRRIGTELRPGILDDLGLAEAIEWQATEFERRSGIEVDVDTPHELGTLADSQSTALFRMFQEILTNVARHAGAKRVVGRLVVSEEQVTLEVTDDGRSIRPEEVANPKSLGLLGMRERAEMHGGTFRIRAARGGGTVVSVTLPRVEEVPT